MMKLPMMPHAASVLLCLFFLSAGSLNAQPGPGRMTDPRDGKQYRTIWIGSQHWMAENLNYGEGERVCYLDDPDFCNTYGGLYSYEVARNVCPDGWHLPDREEWEQLSEYLGTAEAGQKMKASGKDPVPWDGTNASGFSAIPAGAGNGEGFHRMGDWALFWSASEYNQERAWFAQLDGYWYPQPPKYTNLYIGWYYLKSNLFSVRCIEDETQ
jgi:uncharacterized protein (TIGR02145 family)